MRAYAVSVTISDPSTGDDVPHKRFAATQAEASQFRQAYVNDLGVRKSAVEIDEVEIPTAKKDFLDWLNSELN